MPDIPTIYESVQKLHPEAVAQIGEKLRKSRSRYKHDPLKSFSWYYACGMVIRGQSWAEVMDELKNGRKEKILSYDEELRETASRVGVSLCIRKNRSGYGVSLIRPAHDASEKIPDELPDLPPVVLEHYVKPYVKGQRQFREQRKQPPDPAKIQESLRILRRSPGFVELFVPVENE